MDRLHVEAERTAQAAPATVWALVRHGVCSLWLGVDLTHLIAAW